MPTPVLYDSVTLRHFAVISRLDLLESCHGTCDEPRWTAAVKNEITASASFGNAECHSLLETSWLGEAVAPSSGDLKAITHLKIALGNAGYEEEDKAVESKNTGEAESIQIAHRLGYCFTTDDNEAYRVARGRLGPDRVFDTVHLLRLAVANGDLRIPDAIEVANRIRTADRFLRREYERLLTPDDFR